MSVISTPSRAELAEFRVKAERCEEHWRVEVWARFEPAHRDGAWQLVVEKWVPHPHHQTHGRTAEWVALEAFGAPTRKQLSRPPARRKG